MVEETNARAKTSIGAQVSSQLNKVKIRPIAIPPFSNYTTVLTLLLITSVCRRLMFDLLEYHHYPHVTPNRLTAQTRHHCLLRTSPTIPLFHCGY